MSKLWAVALLACALGTNAHAYDAVREVAKQQACLKVIYNTDICHMQQAGTGPCSPVRSATARTPPMFPPTRWNCARACIPAGPAATAALIFPRATVLTRPFFPVACR